MPLQPHEERVLAERAELAERMETRACLPDTVNLFDVNGNHVGKLTTK